MRFELWLLRAYVAVTVGGTAVVLALGAQQASKRARFEEIDVERLNIVEADGSPRMILANRKRAPDVLIGGKSVPRNADRSAGLWFINDRGDECGGLTFGSRNSKYGDFATSGLMFDRLGQDQVAAIAYQEMNGRLKAGLEIWDRPDLPSAEMERKIESLSPGPQRDQAAELFRAQRNGARRVFVGRTEDNDARMVLADAHGKPRLRLVVPATGEPRIEFLSRDGTVTSALAPTK